MGLLDTVKALITGKKEEMHNGLIENNPELILDQAIRDAKELHIRETEKVSRLKAMHTQQVQQCEEKKQNLIKIRQLIGIAQREGNVADVKSGMELFKQREKELEEHMELVTETTEALNDVVQFLTDKQKEIETLEAEKVSLISRLASAKAKEDIMNIRSSIGKDSSSTKDFSKAKEVINNKINNVKGRESINSAVSGSKGSGRFGGL